MTLTASKLRADIYRLLDRVLQTGTPIEVVRKGRVLVIAPKEREPKLSRLVQRPEFVKGDPDDLVHVDWSSEWTP